MISLTLLVLAAGAPATFEEVVVYPDRAQVKRSQTVDCGPRAKVSFEAITPAADGDSFRARIDDGQVQGQRAELSVRADEFNPQLTDAQKQLEQLQLEQTALWHQRDRAQHQLSLSEQLSNVGMQQLSKELAADKPDPKAWEKSFDATLKGRADAQTVLAEVQKKQRGLDERRAVLERKRSELSVSSQRKQWKVEVVVSCPGGKRGKVELTYLVGGASWTPQYEARAEESKSNVELTTWATVTQATGEEWANARLLLSTAVPAQNATPPELSKLMVNAYEQPPEKKVLVRRDEEVVRAQVSGGLPQQAPAQAPLAARAQGLSVQLLVPDRATVNGDGKPMRLFVAKNDLKAKFSFRTVPRALPFVFRVAEVSNQAPFPLLPGVIDLYRPAGFVAKTQLERVAEGAPFTLTFGAEDTLRVKRVVLEELKRDTGLFNGKRRFTYAYRFELANYGKLPAEVELQEGLPVSELDDVQVTVEPKTTAGYKQDATDGIAKWPVKLNPSDKKNIELSFRVDVPSSYDTGP